MMTASFLTAREKVIVRCCFDGNCPCMQKHNNHQAINLAANLEVANRTSASLSLSNQTLTEDLKRLEKELAERKYRTAHKPDCAGYWADCNGVISYWSPHSVSIAKNLSLVPYRFICEQRIDPLPPPKPLPVVKVRRARVKKTGDEVHVVYLGVATWRRVHDDGNLDLYKEFLEAELTFED